MPTCNFHGKGQVSAYSYWTCHQQLQCTAGGVTSVRGRSAPSPVEPTEPGQDDVSATSQLPTPVESRALVPRKRRVPSVQECSRAVVSAPRLLAVVFLCPLGKVRLCRFAS